MVECNGGKALTFLSSLSDHDNIGASLIQRASNFRTIYMTFMTPKLIEVPNGLVYCQNLVQLSLENNAIQIIPEFLCSLSMLKILTLDSNKIKDLPSELKKLTRLKDVNLSHNEISDITPLFECFGIQYVSLNHNQITFIPKSIRKLKDLRGLSLGDNKIQVLPDEVCALKEIEQIYIHNNLLKQLPLHIDQCVSLKTHGGLMVHGNPIRRPPVDVCKGGKGAIFQYFKDLRASERQIRKQQVVLLGETGAGKTSLALTLINNRPCLASAENRTHLLDQYIWNAAKDLKLLVKDLGGHHIYQLAHCFFLCSDIAILLVFNFSEYKHELYPVMVGRWLHSLMTRSCGSSLIVVGTHADCCTKDEIDTIKADIASQIQYQKGQMVSLIEAQLYNIEKKRGQIRRTVDSQSDSFSRYLEDVYESKKSHLEALKNNMLVVPSNIFATSSTQSLWGISDLKSVLVSICKEKSRILPESWFVVQDSISGQELSSQPYVSYDAFCDAVAVGLANSGKSSNDIHAMADALLSYLHQCGEFIWFKDNVDLKNHIFHKPDFIIGFLKAIFHHDMCRILDHENPDFQFKTHFSKVMFEEQKQSFLKHGDVSRQLLYCLVKHLFVDDSVFNTMILLMKKFSLCYEVQTTNEGEDDILHFPWFLTNAKIEDMDTKWPPTSSEDIKFQIEFHFPVQSPEGFYELAAVNLQRCFGQWCCERVSWKDGVFVQKMFERVVLTRRTVQSDFVLTLAARGPTAKPLWTILLSTFNAIVSLLEKWPGVVCDMFYLCPHCLQCGASEPTMFPVKHLLDLLIIEQFVPCKNSENGMVSADMVIPTGKLDSFNRIRLMRRWDDLVRDMNVDDILPSLVSAGLLSPESCEEIRQQRMSSMHQNEKLLMNVLDMDVASYKTFVGILARDHNWLACGLTDGTVSQTELVQYPGARVCTQMVDNLDIQT